MVMCHSSLSLVNMVSQPAIHLVESIDLLMLFRKSLLFCFRWQIEQSHATLKVVPQISSSIAGKAVTLFFGCS